MTEQTLTPTSNYEQERIKILHEECKLQVNDFYEHGIISPLYSESAPFKYDSHKSTEPILDKLFQPLQHLLFLLNKQVSRAPITSLILAGYIGFVLSFFIH